MMKIVNNKYLDRLIQEWEVHSRILIAVDFDDTISPWKLTNDEECDDTISLLKEVKNTGAYIVIFTACHEDRFEYIKSYCRSKGLEIDSINSNPIDLPYGNKTKPYANIYLDDRAGIEEAKEILRQAMYAQRIKLNSLKHLDDVC